MDPVTKEKFLEVYNKHLPNKWTIFAFKYFSLSTQEEDKWLSQLFTGILIALFVIGFTATVANFSKIFIAINVALMAALLVSAAVLLFGAFFMNNFRIRKIRKELGITRKEYNLLVGLYM
jgi:ABC-type multidrug transport system permease subunit